MQLKHTPGVGGNASTAYTGTAGTSRMTREYPIYDPTPGFAERRRNPARGSQGAGGSAQLLRRVETQFGQEQFRKVPRAPKRRAQDYAAGDEAGHDQRTEGRPGRSLERTGLHRRWKARDQ